jgi:hypothetical protein
VLERFHDGYRKSTGRSCWIGWHCHFIKVLVLILDKKLTNASRSHEFRISTSPDHMTNKLLCESRWTNGKLIWKGMIRLTTYLSWPWANFFRCIDFVFFLVQLSQTIYDRSSEAEIFLFNL